MWVADQLCTGGVVEGAQHPGDVAERRRRSPPLRERRGRLTFEVEHDPPGLCAHHLAEVVITMDALDAHGLVEF